MNFAPTHAAPSVIFKHDFGIVPFDQLVTFDLEGKPDNIINKVINISIEGHFVAIAMSYSLLPEEPITFGPIPASPSVPLGSLASLTFGDLFRGQRQALQDKKEELEDSGLSRELIEARIRELTRGLQQVGFRLNPRLADQVLSQGGRNFLVTRLDNALNQLFQAVICRQTEASFLYSITDNATGRELQSEPIHNIAGLGIANGDRPFRFFPQPIIFTPRSVIRVQITEKLGVGRLYFVLQGYKVLGTARPPRE